MNWYALQVRSNTEKVLSMRLSDDGIESYYPHLVIPASRGRRESERKFFPGYLFARFDLEHRLPVTGLTQVVGILGWRCGSEVRPVAIAEEEIAAVRRLIENPIPNSAPKTCPYVAEGDRVAIKRGPLQGLTGFVVYSKGTARIVVSVQMLARSICAEVGIETLELLERAKAA